MSVFDCCVFKAFLVPLLLFYPLSNNASNEVDWKAFQKLVIGFWFPIWSIWYWLYIFAPWNKVIHPVYQWLYFSSLIMITVYFILVISRTDLWNQGTWNQTVKITLNRPLIIKKSPLCLTHMDNQRTLKRSEGRFEDRKDSLGTSTFGCLVCENVASIKGNLHSTTE